MSSILPLAVAMLLIRVGQAMYAVGTARSKNAAAAVMRSLCDLCIATLAFWAIGASILFYTGRRIIGINPDLIIGWGGTFEWMIGMLAIVLVGTGSFAAAIAERSKMAVVCIAPAVLAGLVIPVAGHWIWPGWLYRMTDVGGAAFVHVTVGVWALVGARYVGPRTGKYNRDGSTNMFPGHNVPQAAIGTMMMLVGFVAYAMAITASGGMNKVGAPELMPQAALNALVCIAAAGCSAIILSRVRYGKPDVSLALISCLGAAVAITAAGGYIGSPAAFITGAVAGVIVPLATIHLDLRVHIDDPAGIIGIHLVGGLWGMLCAGIFLRGTASERFVHIGWQLLGVTVIGALALISAAITFAVVKKTIGLRTDEGAEYDGLDLDEHDVGSYPDFQQTMIKSYHLREA